jgi:mono/diheme cytochrome c family protein
VRISGLIGLAGAFSLGLALAACDNMQHQENVRAFDPSTQFADGASARVAPAHTLSRGGSVPGDTFSSGLGNGGWAADLPLPLTRQLLVRGRERFTIFCADCHGDDGYGRGIVVRRGFPEPASFHDPGIRRQPAGRLFAAITRGSGIMYGFGDRIGSADRWAIVAYIRALQKSQDTSVSELSTDERRRLSPQ